MYIAGCNQHVVLERAGHQRHLHQDIPAVAEVDGSILPSNHVFGVRLLIFIKNITWHYFDRKKNNPKTLKVMNNKG